MPNIFEERSLCIIVFLSEVENTRKCDNTGACEYFFNAGYYMKPRKVGSTCGRLHIFLVEIDTHRHFINRLPFDANVSGHYKSLLLSNHIGYNEKMYMHMAEPTSLFHFSPRSTVPMFLYIFHRNGNVVRMSSSGYRRGNITWFSIRLSAHY